MPPRVCLTCKESTEMMKNHITKLEDMPEWKLLRGDTTYFPNDKVIDLHNIKLSTPSKATTCVKINLGASRNNRFVFYFAAEPSKNDLEHIEANKAYGKFKNSGVAKTDKDGCATLKIRCPQNYKEKGLWYPHIHFLVSNASRTKWNSSLYTKLVLCPIKKNTVKEAIKTRSHLILNSLPLAYYIKSSIPGSYPLPLESICHLSKKEVVKYIAELLHHTPKIKKAVDTKKISIYDIPIIVYCYNKTCTSSTRLIKHLWKLGFKNIKEYEEGIMGWK